MRRRDFIAAAAASAAAWPMLGHAQQPGKMRRIGVLMSFAVNDLRRDPLAVRKATLASLVAHAAPGLRLNEHLDHDDGQLVLE